MGRPHKKHKEGYKMAYYNKRKHTVEPEDNIGTGGGKIFRKNWKPKYKGQQWNTPSGNQPTWSKKRRRFWDFGT